ncbi:MAG: hypothetical protein LBQ69_05550, partial [Treponema sp.]|nr:hypothetical protein [Treponema sp.]
MNTRKIAAALALAALAFTACPSPSGGNGDSRISIAAITGVALPAIGQAPVTAIPGTDQYAGTVLWSPLVTGAFAAATQYTAIITLTANPGYTFAGVAANSFTVAGATSVRNAKNSGTVTAAFPTTAGTAGEPAVVDIAAIPGVALPATYAAPVTAIGVTEQYTGTVSWSPLVTGTFAPYKAYTATIRLRANPGFTFAGVAADFFTVAGATSASNAANSYTVTAAFPATGGIPVPVSIAAIPGVTAPLTYETPVAAIAETAQYTGTVAWSPEVSGAFAAETEYTATITLEAKAGFTFDGVAAGFFTVAGAASVGNAAYSGTIMATFPAIPFMEMVPVSGGTFTM